MTSAINLHNPNQILLNFCSAIYAPDILVSIINNNVLQALQWEAILLRAVFRLQNTVSDVLTRVKEETLTRLKRPEVIISERVMERVDVRNADNIPTKQQAGQKKGKKKKKSSKQAQRQRAERAKREEADRERLRQWEECWEKKIQAEEERNNAECCVSKGLCVKPRTQSNIWINVNKDRSIQEIHMIFKHVPVPRPKPPPLPPLPLKTEKPSSASTGATQKRKLKKADKKVGPSVKSKRK